MNVQRRPQSDTAAFGWSLLSTMALIGLWLLMCVSSTEACRDVNDVWRVNDSNTVYVEDCVHVHENASIEVWSGCVLILTGNNGDNVSTIETGGEIKLEDGCPVLRITTNDHTFTGPGRIIGESDGGEIQIGCNESGRTLTNATNIEGALQIISGALATNTTFVNNGKVEANDSWLEVYPDALGSGSGEWKVTGSGSKLWFRRGSTSQTGDFTVSAGTLDIDATVETTGHLNFTGGQIEVAEGVHLTINK
jgi:hypothetical protein